MKKLIIVLAALLANPAGFARGAGTVSWTSLIERLGDPVGIARLDREPAVLLASTDPGGGNNDFNHNVKPGPEGWWIIADLEGPGYVSRFWFTGGHPDGTHGLRLLFDGEKKPRLDTTVGAFCGGQEPFVSPLAGYENYCWYNLVPIPYQKRLVIMVQQARPPPALASKIYFQINAQKLSSGRTVASAAYPVPEAVAGPLRDLGRRWRASSFPALPGPPADPVELKVEPGQRQWAPAVEGPALGRELRIEPVGSPAAQAGALRSLRLLVRYDGQEKPGIDVPLGSFFGSMTIPIRYRSMFFGMEKQALVSRFPMPFDRSIQIGLANDGPQGMTASVRLKTEARSGPEADLGYLHAVWNRTGPQDVGKPHPILRFSGARGRYAGCLLSVTSADRSWWILEGDESIRIDGEQKPSWLGTGLEDYFNGGWYYQNALARPLHGLPFKAPFRTIQYRLHLPDPVLFENAVEVMMERGPDQASRGWMESTAWYYLDRPVPEVSRAWKAGDRPVPDDGMAQATIQHELNNLERLGDFRGAADHLAAFRRRNSKLPYDDLLALRALGYRERFEGFAAVQPAYGAFIAAQTNAYIRKQAEDLVWLHEDPRHALLGVYSNGRTDVLVSGMPLGTVQDPIRMQVFRVKLPPGRHSLGLVSHYQPYPSWMQVALRTSGGIVGSQADWKYHFAPPQGWEKPGFDDGSWQLIGATGVKGPPEVPHVYLEPNGLVGFQSAAVGIRPPEDKWADKRAPCAVRHSFVVPVPGK